LPVSRRTIKAMLNGSPPSNRNGRGPGVGSPNQNARALTYLDPSRASTPTPTRWPLSNRHREYHRDNRRRLTRTRRKLRHQRRSDRRLRHRRITRENQSGLILTSTIGLILESASGPQRRAGGYSAGIARDSYRTVINGSTSRSAR
jgi:hypothetical protein